MGCHFLLQVISLTQGSNSHLLHWQVDFFTAKPPEKPPMSWDPFLKWKVELNQVSAPFWYQYYTSLYMPLLGRVSWAGPPPQSCHCAVWGFRLWTVTLPEGSASSSLPGVICREEQEASQGQQLDGLVEVPLD